MDRHQRNGILATARGRVRLAQVARVAQAHQLDEAREIRPAIALVGTRCAHQLASIAEATLAVGRGETGEVVVVLGDDALQQRGEPELAARAHEPVIQLPEAIDEGTIAFGQTVELPELDRPVERALGGVAQRREPVVGDAHERGGEDDQERMVVEAVAQKREVGAQVAHLLRAIEAAAELTARHEPDAFESAGVRRGVARGAQQHRDLAGWHPVVDELA